MAAVPPECCRCHTGECIIGRFFPPSLHSFRWSFLASCRVIQISDGAHALLCMESLVLIVSAVLPVHSFLSQILAASGLLSLYSFAISRKSYTGSHIMNCFHFGYFHLITSLRFQSCLPLEHLITHCLGIPWSLSSHGASGHPQGIFSKVMFKIFSSSFSSLDLCIVYQYYTIVITIAL